jgi:hypothetical protein
VVDVVGELFLDAYFLLFLVQREGVLAVAVGSSNLVVKITKKLAQ